MIAVGMLAWSVRAAFSHSRTVANYDSLEASLALPAQAYWLEGNDALSLAHLRQLVFDEDDVAAVLAGESGEDDDAVPEVAPRWTENNGDDDPEPEIPEQRFRVTSHTVRSGESLRSIAAHHGISVKTIVSYNGLSGTTVRPGRKLELPNVDGVRIRVGRGDSLWDIARRHRIRMKDVLEFNGIRRPGDVRAGEFLFLPGARELSKPEASRPPGRRTIARPTPVWTWPVVGGRLSSRFGYRRHPITGRILFHRGIDVSAAHGTPIRAYKAGTVIFSGMKGGYGYTVDIRHGNGIVTRYAHNSKNLVRVGQQVRAGDVIAKVGSTGHSTGPHIHFEVIRGGERVDPIKFHLRG